MKGATCISMAGDGTRLGGRDTFVAAVCDPDTSRIVFAAAGTRGGEGRGEREGGDRPLKQGIVGVLHMDLSCACPRRVLIHLGRAVSLI